MSKQTAVEWLVEQFEESHSYINEIFKETIEQAKEMEKQQIIDAVDDPKYVESHKTPSTIPGIDSHSMFWFMNGKQYYDHKYGGGK